MRREEKVVFMSCKIESVSIADLSLVNLKGSEAKGIALGDKFREINWKVKGGGFHTQIRNLLTLRRRQSLRRSFFISEQGKRINYPIRTDVMEIDPIRVLSLKKEISSFSSFIPSVYKRGR